MTKPEMNRRLATIPADLLKSGFKMVLDGYGARGMTLESNLTLKQANALHEWHNRYGRIYPQATHQHRFGHYGFRCLDCGTVVQS